MTMQWIRLILVLLSFTVISMTGGCSLAGTPTPTVMPSGSVLFLDEFNFSSGDWKTISMDGTRVECEEGKLVFSVDDPYLDQWSVVGDTYTDTTILVIGQKNNGPDDNQYGLICRYQDEEHFYAFTIGSDGYGGIWKKEPEGVKMLSASVLEFHPEISTENQSNTIRADCVGEQLTLWVNGVVVEEVIDNSYTTGNVGLLAGSFSEGGVGVAFDHFIIIQP